MNLKKPLFIFFFLVSLLSLGCSGLFSDPPPRAWQYINNGAVLRTQEGSKVSGRMKIAAYTVSPWTLKRSQVSDGSGVGDKRPSPSPSFKGFPHVTVELDSTTSVAGCSDSCTVLGFIDLLPIKLIAHKLGEGQVYVLEVQEGESLARRLIDKRSLVVYLPSYGESGKLTDIIMVFEFEDLDLARVKLD